MSDPVSDSANVVDVAYPHVVQEWPADPVAAAGVLEDAQAELVRAEIRQVLAVAHVCDLHPGPDEDIQPSQGVVGRLFGDDGTPVVSEYVPLEVGPLLGVSPTTAAMLIRDVLNLRHRHPRLWEAMCAGRVRVWQARKIAQRVARESVSVEIAHEVDAIHSPMIEGNAWSKVMRLLEGVIAVVDPEGVAQRNRVRQGERFVRTRRGEAMGIGHVWARAEVGDVAHFEAMIDRLACVQAELAGADHEDPDDHQVWRSKALRVLANPAQALALLKQAADQNTSTDPDTDTCTGPGPGPGADTDPDTDPGGMDEEPNSLEQILRGDCVVPPSLIAACRPKTTLVVHLHHQGDLARVARWGWLQQPGDLNGVLAGSQITVQPVIDLNANLSSESYQVPESIKKQIRLRNPIEAYPYSDRASVGRGIDIDHTVAWPRGATESTNLGPFGRSAHRGKTHAGYQMSQLEAGVITLTTRLGYRYETSPERTVKRRPVNRQPGTTRTTVGAVVHTLAVP